MAGAGDRQDAACVARIRSGDAEAFGELAAAYTQRIVTHLYRMTGSHEEAEDLTQDTFIRAIRYLPRYDARRPFRNWIYGIATNVGIDACAKRSRTQALPLDAERDVPSVAVDAGAQETQQRRETAERLQAAIHLLPPRSAALLNLHYFEGMTLREAGEVLDMEEGAAKVALHRARKRLRTLLVDSL